MGGHGWLSLGGCGIGAASAARITLVTCCKSAAPVARSHFKTPAHAGSVVESPGFMRVPLGASRPWTGFEMGSRVLRRYSAL